MWKNLKWTKQWEGRGWPPQCLNKNIYLFHLLGSLSQTEHYVQTVVLVKVQTIGNVSLSIILQITCDSYDGAIKSP